MKRKSKIKRRIIIATALVAILIVIGFSMRDRAEGVSVTVAEVGTATITSTVTGTGRIHPEIEVRISSEVAGEIIELPVSDGSRVARGDLLVRVNPDTLDAQVKQQEASLSAIRANSAQNLAEKLKAQLDLRRVEELHQRGFATEDQLDQSRTLLEVRRASHQASLHQIERQEMQLKEARDLLAKASTFSPIEGTVVRLNAEVGDRVVGTGQFEGTQIMRVANLDSMEVRIDVSEADIVHVAVGQIAEVEVDAIPNEMFTGTVTEISHSAQTTAERSQEQLTTFSVKVKLDDPSPRIRPGMTATAEIQTATVEDVVGVPLLSVVVRPAREVREALSQDSDEKTDGKRPADTEGERRERGSGTASSNRNENRSGEARGGRLDQRRIVFVVSDGVAQLREVETGIADRNRIEIKSGLEPGETIVTGSYRALTRELSHGSPIVVEESGRTPWER